MRYIDLKAENEKRINAVPMKFAFSEAQFAKVLEDMDCTVEDLVRVPGGGFIKKSDKHLLTEAVDACEKAMTEYLATDEGLLDALEYELANHEYCITYDPTDALDVLGLEHDDERVTKLLPKAVKSYMAGVI